MTHDDTQDEQHAQSTENPQSQAPQSQESPHHVAEGESHRTHRHGRHRDRGSDRAIAIIVGAVRFIGWRVQVNEALTAQSQSQSQYDFNPGNIISDGTFFNGNALSEQQVSTIIEQQGVACSGERCLKSMTFSTESQSADEYCQAYDGGPNESAAAIVYKAGKACGISQKVLLTVLQRSSICSRPPIQTISNSKRRWA